MLTAHTKSIGSDSTEQWQALIRCTNSVGEYLWQRELNIARTTKEDALSDAYTEIEYIESLGQ